MSDETREKYEGFIASDDIGYDASGGSEITLTVESVAEAGTVKDAKGTLVDHPVVYFAKAKKGLVLNRTNERILKLLLGKDRSAWSGKKVTLGIGFISAFGEHDIPTIRVRPPKGVPLPFGVRKWMGRAKPVNQ